MEHTNVLDPLNVQNTLDCIAGNYNCLNIYSDIYVQYKKKTGDMPTTKFKTEFFEVLQSLCTARSKSKFGKLSIHYFALIYHVVKVINPKKLQYMYLTVLYLMAAKAHTFRSFINVNIRIIVDM